MSSGRSGELQRELEAVTATLNSIGDALIATDVSGRVTRMNPVAETLTGWKLVDALGRPLSEVASIVSEYTQEALEDPVEATLRGGIADSLGDDLVLLGRGGTMRPIAGTRAPIRDGEATLHGVVLVLRGRTEQVARASETSEARYRSLRDAGILGIVVADTSGAIKEVNDAFLSIVGYTREDFVAGKVSGTTLNTPERDRTDAAARQQLSTKGVAAPWEKELVRKDGTRVPILCGVVMLDRAADESVAFVLDLTARKRAEQAARLSEERLALAHKVTQIGAFEWNIQTNENTWTPELERMYGLAAGDFGRTQQSWEELVHRDDRAAANASVNRALETFAPVEGEWRVVWRDGTVRSIAGRFQCLKDANGKPHRLIGVNIDITERKNGEVARRTAEHDAERARDQAAERLQILAESSHQFASITNVHELVETIARRLGEVVGEGCAVRLLAREGGVFHAGVTATYHPDPVLMEDTRQHAATQPLRLGEGVSGRVALTGEPLLFPVITTEQILAQTPPEYHSLMKRHAITTLLVVPLKAGGRVIGVISMSRRDPRRPYTAEDQRLAQDIADRAALSIENAALLAELEQRVIARTEAFEQANGELRRLKESLESEVDARTTELREANVALQRSEARFRRLTESGIIGITVSNLEGQIEDANDAFLEMTGYSREDFRTGKVTARALRSPASEAADAVATSALRAGGVARAWERVLVHRDGRHVPVLVGAATIDASSHETIAFILNLSERKDAEAKARESEARKAAVMEAALDAIVLMDHEGRITEFNPAAERTFGYTRAEVIGKPLADVLIPPHLRARHVAGLEHYLASGKENILSRRIELPALTKDGTEFPAEVAVVRIRSEGAAVFTGYIRDITERRQAAEAEIHRREKEAAQAANRELEAFSYSVAHDLRAPLRAISGFSGVILEDHGNELNADAKGQLHRIVAAGERMGHIIDALLSLARLSRTELRRETVDLTALARSVVQQLRAIDRERSVEFVATDGVTASGDPRLLHAVLENLLGNAWKFTKHQPHAKIEFGCTLLPDAIRYYIRDNGAGFDMSYAAQLFKPFQRLHSTAQFEGTGIGLATVQRIIVRHGGRVWAEGTVGEGATFYFTVPPESSTRGVSWIPPR